MKALILALGLVLGLALSAEAQTVTNTVSWATEPANVETYLVEKQVGGAAQPWVAMPANTAVPPALQFVDAGNTPGVQVCYRVTPSNSLPSTGASAQNCSLTMGAVGDMPTITIIPQIVP